MPKVVYGKSEIEFSVKRSSSRTTVDVAVDPNKGVLVTCPPDLSEDRIRQVVMKKAPWILQKRARMTQVDETPSPREFVSGETFHYLGKGYRLKVIEDKSVHPFDIKLTGGRFRVRVPPDSVETPRLVLVDSALQSWFIKKAEKRLMERVELYSPRVGNEPAGVIVKNQMKRWGSCTKDGILNLNWKIIMAPMSVVDYVVVHELVHLGVQDHSREFWQKMRVVLPDYERRKEWLRVHGPSLGF